MQILKRSFLYTLFAFVIVAGAAAVFPATASASGSCTITQTEWPGAIYVNEDQSPYHMSGYCQDVPNYVKFGIRDLSGGNWVAGPQTKWQSGFVSFDITGSYEWGSTGSKQIEGRVNWDADIHPPYNLTGGSDTDRRTITVTTRPEQCSLSNLDISGPDSVTIPSGDSSTATRYDADYNYSADDVRYRFLIENEWYDSWRSTTGSQVNDYISFDQEGTYRVCIEAQPRNGGSTCSSSQMNCMPVTVTNDPGVEGCMDPDATNYNPNATISDPDSCNYDNPDPGEATLRVNSSNPSSGAGMDVTSGNISDFNTQRTFTDSNGITATIWADRTASGNNFSDWDNCADVGTNDRRCDVQVNPGESKTITAEYTPAGDPNTGCTDPNANNFDPNATQDDGSCDYDNTNPSKATLDVNSTPFTGVSINHVHEWLLGPGDDTNYIKEYDEDIQETWIQAPTTYDSGGTEYQIADWDGCKSTADGGHSCKVAAFDVGEVRSITVNYEVAPQDPAEIDNFNLSDPNLDTSVNPPELHVDDQPFDLVWSTTNANSVEGDWGGNPKNLNDSENINEGSISGNKQTFSYTLTAYGDGDNDSATEQVTLLDPPRFSLSSDPETDIGGEPGSQATLEVTATPYKYNGDMEFTIEDDGISLTKLSKLNFLFRTGRFSRRKRQSPAERGNIDCGSSLKVERLA